MILQYRILEKMPKIDIQGYWDYTDWWGSSKFLGAERKLFGVKKDDIIFYNGQRYRVAHIKQSREMGRYAGEEFFHVFVLRE